MKKSTGKQTSVVFEDTHSCKQKVTERPRVRDLGSTSF